MKKALGIVVGILLSFLIAGYVAGCFYFRDHFYYGTVIDGVLCGCLDISQSELQLVRKQETYVLTVTGRKGLSDLLQGTEAGLALEPREELQKLLERQRYVLWPVSFLEEHVYELKDSLKLDETVFQRAVYSLSMFQLSNMQWPEDACISPYLPEKKGYEVIPEDKGNWLRKQEALEAVREAVLQRREELSLTEDRFYEQPSVFAEDPSLQRMVQERNALTGQRIVYDMHGVEAVLDGDQIHQWLTEEEGTLKIDEEKAAAYVQELAERYDTYGKERSFTTVKGEERRLRSGAYGWKLDVKKEQQALLEMLQKGEDCTREPEWVKKGYVKGASDIGENYVEIDLGNQTLYLIEEGEVILESPLVSGNMARGWGTPAGVFGVTYKTRNAVLRGADYASPVSFWIPFNRNIGMHDASWRRSFGGNIYQTNGSHGCINLPYQKAKEVYNFVKTNMPVVCYY